MTRAGAACLCLLLAAGCGPVPSAAVGPRVELTLFEYRVEELSDLAAYLADVDQGRLRVAPPVEWRVAPRSKDYVVRFVLYSGSDRPLPRITLEASDDSGTAEAAGETKLSQLAEIAQAVAKRETQARDISLLILGQVPCVRYTLSRTFRAGDRTYRGEREVLLTVAQGRRYTVTLDAFAGKLDDYRADAFAVMAGLQFVSPSSEPASAAGAKPDAQPDPADPIAPPAAP